MGRRRELIGDRIYRLRTAREWPQAELAKRCSHKATDRYEYDSSTVSSWESGRRTPSLRAAMDIAKAFGLTLDELTSNAEVYRRGPAHRK